MNTEDRLRDALHAAAHAIENPPPFPARRSAFNRPLAAALAVTAVLGGAAYLSTDLFPFPTSNPVLSTPAIQKVSVYLCIRTSSNRNCHGDTTESQREVIAERLRALPEVRTVTYESREEAYRRFGELFEESPGFVDATEPGDIPDSFRLEADSGSATVIEAALADLPGVDTVVAVPPGTP